MNDQVDPTLLDSAVELVQEAGRLTLEWFRGDSLDLEHKADGTPVTRADRAVERFLREQLEIRFPDDAILGEEEADKPGTSGRQWVIDPIDGTKAFSHGVPLYSNLLALEDAHGCALGVLNVPALGETVYAARGLGCWCNGDRCRVSSRSSLDGAYISTSGFNPWTDEAMIAVKNCGASLRTWGDAYGYALVATGRIEAMVDPEVAHWDVAPMPVILAEAGGRFSDYSGAATVHGGSGIASNGAVHQELIELLSG